MNNLLKFAVMLLTIPLIFSFASCSNIAEASSQEPHRSDFWMTGSIQNIGDRIEIEVIEGEYAYGVYWVIYDSATFYDENGNTIKLSDLKLGDKIKVTYGGQVMMSYPPQIVASKIQRI